ncbi:Glypican-1 [Labeo rohita]|uniref:Glypican-1 n=1 Tax=Labeo rohita TaxID=84645 RepID=A0ABQ8N179_LABRO|nr:Glypican-1 [Labeo rohita]
MLEAKHIGCVGFIKCSSACEHLRACSQGYTCCTSGMEENLLNLSRREFETQVKESGRTLQASLNGQYKSFDDLCLISQSSTDKTS